MPTLSTFDQSVQDFINWFDEIKNSGKLKQFLSLGKSAKYVEDGPLVMGFFMVGLLASLVANTLFGVGKDILPIVVMVVSFGCIFSHHAWSKKRFKKYKDSLNIPAFESELQYQRPASENTVLQTIQLAKDLQIKPEIVDLLIKQNHTDGVFWGTLYTVLNKQNIEQKKSFGNEEEAKELTLQEKKELLAAPYVNVQVNSNDNTSPKSEKNPFGKFNSKIREQKW